MNEHNITPVYYKILGKGHRACHGGTYRYTPGRWTRREKVNPCVSGWHIVTAEQAAARWLCCTDAERPIEVWECEAENVTDAGDKCVAGRIRLTRLLGTLDEYDLRWLGTLFAESVLQHTDDPRVGECINTVRAYCVGQASARDLSAAWSVAESAAESAAWQTTLDYLEATDD